MLPSPKALRTDHLVIFQQPSLRQLPGLSRVWRSRNTCWGSAKLPLARGEESGPFAPLGASAGVAFDGAFPTQQAAESRATAIRQLSSLATAIGCRDDSFTSDPAAALLPKTGSRAALEDPCQVLLRPLPKVSTPYMKVSLGFSRR